MKIDKNTKMDIDMDEDMNINVDKDMKHGRGHGNIDEDILTWTRSWQHGRGTKPPEKCGGSLNWEVWWLIELGGVVAH